LIARPLLGLLTTFHGLPWAGIFSTNSLAMLLLNLAEKLNRSTLASLLANTC